VETGVGGIFIFVDSTGISGVSVIVAVRVGEAVCVGCGDGESVIVGVDSAVNESLAASTDVDEHPLSSAAASIIRITGSTRGYRDTASMVEKTDKMFQFYHLTAARLAYLPVIYSVQDS
jgi:hypothetical protein